MKRKPALPCEAQAEPKENETVASTIGEAAVELRRHQTPESIIREHWSFADPDVFEHADELILGGAEDGVADFMFSPNDMLEGIKEQGLWAFADTKKKIVHLWASSDVSRDDLLSCLAHEVGHLVGTSLRGHMEEERRADSYGIAAVTAMRWIDAARTAQQEGTRDADSGLGTDHHEFGNNTEGRVSNGNY